MSLIAPYGLRPTIKRLAGVALKEPPLVNLGNVSIDTHMNIFVVEKMHDPYYGHPEIVGVFLSHSSLHNSGLKHAWEFQERKGDGSLYRDLISGKTKVFKSDKADEPQIVVTQMQSDLLLGSMQKQYSDQA
jgi:hypothetical protein